VYRARYGSIPGPGNRFISRAREPPIDTHETVVRTANRARFDQSACAERAAMPDPLEMSPSSPPSPSPRSSQPLPAANALHRLHVTDQKDVKVVSFIENKILDEANIAEIGQGLASLIENRHRPKILLDF